MAKKRLRRMPYRTVEELLKHELPKDEGEHDGTADLIKQLKHVRARKVASRPEFLSMCHWKSHRAVKHYSKNRTSTIQGALRTALSTRSERTKHACLTKLKGVNTAMASAILMLTDPKRYGVLDIRVWQLLYAMRAVSSNPSGKSFSFNNWYHYLSILRYFAKKHNVSAREVERTLFRYHKQMQIGKLYRD